MLLKLGVDISRLSDAMRRALPVIDQCFQKATSQEEVCTWTYEGTHSTAILHYVNRAADFRLPAAPKVPGLVMDLKQTLGKGYDVVAEPSPATFALRGR